MTNTEAKHQVFMEAHAKWLANQEKHYGYNENAGKYQDDLNEMVWADWDFTEAHEKSGEITPCTSKKVSTPTKQS